MTYLTTRIKRGQISVRRANKLARGMSETVARHKAGYKLSDDARKLSVFGTLDGLARVFDFTTKRLPCPCCGSKNAGKLILNDSGRRKLKIARRKLPLTSKLA